jgi:hypothetical protein
MKKLVAIPEIGEKTIEINSRDLLNITDAAVQKITKG